MAKLRALAQRQAETPITAKDVDWAKGKVTGFRSVPEHIDYKGVCYQCGQDIAPGCGLKEVICGGTCLNYVAFEDSVHLRIEALLVSANAKQFDDIGPASSAQAAAV